MYGRCNRAKRLIRVVRSGSRSVLPLLVACSAIAQAVVDKPAKPSFKASGIQGTTAPSGYSGGASEEHGMQAATLAARLLEDNLQDLLSPNPPPCDQQAKLLHAALTDPGSFEANDRLGIFYLQHENPKLARRYLALAWAKREQDRQTLLDLAIAEVEEHSYAEALDAADRLLRGDARDAAAHRIRGTVEALNHTDAAALADYQAAAKFDPSDSNLFAQGLATLLLGSASDAEQQFRTATSVHPQSALLWFGLGTAEAVLRKTAESIAALSKAMDLDPGNLLAASLLAQQSGGSAAADTEILRRMEALVQRHPASAVARYDHAIVLYRMGKASNAIGSIRSAAGELREAISEAPDLAAAHFQLALVEDDLLERGELNVTREAIASQLRRAVDLDPDVAEWHYRLSRAYTREHQADLAAAEMQKFQELKRARGEGAGTRLSDELPIQSMHGSSVCEVGSGK